jgi:hypothetical protein
VRGVNVPVSLPVMSIEDVARVAHEINRAYCQGIGDDSQPEWHLAPDWQKESAVTGVKLHLENPAAGPEASHESWMAEKLAAGWVYGELKDAEKKTHPCLVPFAHLGLAQQAKDYVFRQVVHSLRRFTVQNVGQSQTQT